VEANDAGAMCLLANYYLDGRGGLQQDHARAMELYDRAADLGFSKAHFSLGLEYKQQGDMKKARFHYEAAAVAGHEAARCNLGTMEANSGNMERACEALEDCCISWVFSCYAYLDIIL
jgi:localization factor PodJL